MLTLPCRHLVIDNFLDRHIAEAIAQEFPDAAWPHWLDYLSRDQFKKTCNVPFFIPAAVMTGLRCLLDFPAGESLGLGRLEADPSFHGGGMHTMSRDGRLGIHLDCDRHPVTRMQRRANAIYFASRSWETEWGGSLILMNGDKSAAVEVEPTFNRIVLFEATDESWHGVPQPLTCPENASRNTLAVYYWSDPVTEAKRPTALFS